MKPKVEGRVWQVLGSLVAVAAALEIRSAAQQFNWTFSQKYAGFMDVVWPFAMGLFAGFLLLTGATAMISGHVLRVISGVTHRGWMWKVAGLFCCLAGAAVILVKMEEVVLSRGVRIAQSEDFYNMLGHGGFALWISGGYVFLLGIMLLMADRVGTRLRSTNTGQQQRG